MSAGIYDYTVEQGATFIRVFTWNNPNGTPVDLTGYTARMQIRQSVVSPTYYYQALSGGDIVLGGSAGTITLTIPAPTSAAWTFIKGVYDLELQSPSGIVTRLVQGNVTVSREVTR